MSVSKDSNTDIEVAMAGGSTFDQRISELAAAKQSLMDAYSDLGLGQSAKLAYESARAEKAAAEKVLADAKAAAESIISKAQAEAQSVVHAAKVRADEARRSALDEAAKAKADAAALLASAKSSFDDAQQKLQSAAVKDAEISAVKERLEKASREAEEAAARKDALSEQLKEARAKLAASLSDLNKNLN